MNILYIDAQNTHQRTVESGRLIDRSKFFLYCKKRYKIDKIYYAIGFVSKNKYFYNKLENIGYNMIYKETMFLPNGKIKGNVDIDIAIKSIFELTSGKLKKAYLLTNDGDFNSLIKTFIQHGIWGRLISPDVRVVSKLLTRLDKDVIDLNRIKHLITKTKRP